MRLLDSWRPSFRFCHLLSAAAVPRSGVRPPPVARSGCTDGPLYSAAEPDGPRLFGANPTAPWMSSRHHDQANVSTQQPEAEEDARVQDQDANPRRPPHPGPAPSEAPGEHLGLSGHPLVEDRIDIRVPNSQMAPTAKLRTNSDFRRVVQGGKRGSGKRVTMYWIPSEGPGRPGFVAKRELGGAVVRNRARRMLREAWRQVGPSVGRPVDVVFVARPAMAGAKTFEVVQEIRALLVRQGLIET
jgi:ribonuclease P protein component